MNKIAEQIKQILIDLCINGDLPSDLNELDSNLFLPALQPYISLLITLREDAQMAIDEEWDRTNEGFLCQIDLIDELLKP